LESPGVVGGNAQSGGLFQSRFGKQHRCRKVTKFDDCLPTQSNLFEGVVDSILGVTGRAECRDGGNEVVRGDPIAELVNQIQRLGLKKLTGIGVTHPPIVTALGTLSLGTRIA
jgi:hypothetical protein